MDYLNYLYGLKREGIKLGLDIMSSFSERIGNPQERFRSVHIAGTNGKGSTAAILYNILSGKFRTGLYTSPHLIDFKERILFDGDFITDQYMTDFVREYYDLIMELSNTNRNPTFFEATTAMAFKFFADKDAEFASVEVGLGGRLDSTNIINPEVSVITSIGYEHASRLGSSLDTIAFEKGGIIKHAKPVVLGDSKPDVVRAIKKLCTLRECTLITVDSNASVEDIQMDRNGLKFKLNTDLRQYSIESGMKGVFQIRNIETAVLAAEQLEDSGIGRNEIIAGIKKSIYPARLETVRESPLVVIDSAHNPPAAHALVDSYSRIFKEKPHLLVGMLSDKDHYSYLKALSKLSDSITLTRPDDPGRSFSPFKLQAVAKDLFTETEVIEDPEAAYYAVRDKYASILVTGSIYLVGVIKRLEHSPIRPFL